MKRVGIGGVTMFDVAQPGIPAGPHRYMDAGWQKMFAHEISEARRLGLEVMSQNGPGYSGNGGPWITPEFGSQKIVETATRIPGGKRFSGTLPQAQALGGYYRDVAVLAIQETDAQAKELPLLEDFDMKRLVWLNYIRWKGSRSAPLDAKLPPEKCIPAAHVIDISRQMKPDGSITWDAPAGTWTLLRFGHAWTGQKTLPATPEGEGPECDKLHKRGIQKHFDHIMKRMVELAGPEAGKAFHTFFVDSWEAGGQNWTEEMPAEFQRRRGYDIIPYLPILTGRVIGDVQMSERFLYDLRLTVSELVTENFWAEMQRLCHAHGMRLAVQPYITTGQDLDAANFTDEPMGEFWSHPFQPNDYRTTIKAAVSAANLNNQLIVGAEAFTASETERWLAPPGSLKELGDKAFCLGANRFQIHRFAMQRFPQVKPGMTMGKWGQHYDSTQTWWEWSKPWHDYLARCQYMLRQGPVVTDVLALAPEEPLHRFEHKPISGYDYDVCGPDNFKRVAIIDGKVGIPGGPSYHLITVDHHGTMSLARLKKLRELIVGGARVLCNPPLVTPGLENFPKADDELKAIAAELWGNDKSPERQLGKGLLFRGITPAEALQRLKVPAAFTGPAEISWIHRRSGDVDLFFLATGADKATSVSCTFRVSGKTAELWQPETGATQPLELIAAADGRSTGEIPFLPDGSTFVVFRPGDSKPPAVAAPEVALLPPAELKTSWKLAFPAGRKVSPALDWPKLISWSKHSNPNIRHFSGTATYSTSIQITNAQSKRILDLGKVHVMARVHLNGKDLGILWKAPYRVDITAAAREGANDLKIEVVNLWPNRLIGDAGLPKDAERDANGQLTAWPKWLLSGKPAPHGRQTFVTYPLWKQGEPLLDSGMLGPVTISAATCSTAKK